MKAEGRRQKAEEAIAALLEYPDGELGRHVARAIDALLEHREVLDEVIAFYDEVGHVTPEGLEELYTRTFDLNPVASLDLGWHLYGEQYERGRLLAMLRETELAAGVDSGTELPDHLTVVLQLISRIDIDARLRQQVAIALGKIKAPLDEQGNPYRHLIRAAEILSASGRPLLAMEVH